MNADGILLGDIEELMDENAGLKAELAEHKRLLQVGVKRLQEVDKTGVDLEAERDLLGKQTYKVQMDLRAELAARDLRIQRLLVELAGKGVSDE